MKTHTTEFKNKIKQYGRELDTIITYTLNNEDIELGNTDLNSVNPHYKGAILKSVMRQLDIDSNVEIPIGTLISVQFGVKVRNEITQDYRDNYDYINFGNYIVKDVEKQEDTGSYKITCYDKLLNSMVDYENIGVTYPISVRDYINALANHLGLTFKNASSNNFANWNKEIANEKYLDSDGNSLGYTFRDVLDELAQVTASTICINEDDDELEIRYITNSIDTIDGEFLKNVNVNFGEKYGPINSIVLSRSAGADNVYLQDTQSVEANGLCEIKITDNQIMNDNDRASYLLDILSKLDGLEYYLNDFSSTGICYYNLCDRYTINIDNESYSCVMLDDDVSITQGLEETIYTERPEQAQTDYTKADKTDRKINQTYFIVDKQNQQIESVISTVDSQNSKISQITQTVDELNAKISDIADVTTSGESNEAAFTLENINASEPIQVKIKPLGENISYLYPNSNLYPSNSLYSKVRTLRFENTEEYEVTSDTIYNNYRKYYSYDGNDYTLLVAGTDYTIGNAITGTIYQNVCYDYELPDDLLYYSASVYDEFYLDYETETCQITKRCEYNSNGSVSPTGTETINTYTYPHINLTDGNYNISILGYTAGYIYARLMASNIYTTQFATRVEMTSAINQKADEINIVVAEKLDEEEFTHAEIVAKINDDTSQIKIDADQVDIEANDVLNILAGNTINLTSKGINIQSDKFNVTTGGVLSCTDANVSGTINASNGSFTGNINAQNGNIGGFNIANNQLYSGSVGVSGDNGHMTFWAGSSDPTTAPFRVDPSGGIYASNAVISGDINATSGTFRGTVYANSGSFSGSVTSSSGTIGGWTIASSRLQGNYGGTTYAIRPYGVDDVSHGRSISWSMLISSSDKKLKNNINKIDEKYEEFYNNLKPSEFYFNDGIDNGKKHFGFIAQDIIANEGNLDEDLAMVDKPDKSKYYNLDKQEIIALNTWQIQKLKSEVEELKKEIAKLKGGN